MEVLHDAGSGADVNVQDSVGATVLHAAANKGDFAITASAAQTE